MKKMLARMLSGAVFTASVIGFAAPGMAQLTPAQQNAVDIQTGTASPSRAVTTFDDGMFVPRVTPRVDVKSLQVQAPPPGAENITFELGGIKMDGATVYAPGELRSVYAGRIGETITLADLYTIAGEITRKYRNDGYILTQVVVPPQTIEGGIATLRVVEGRINRVEVRGPEDVSMNLVRAYASQVKGDGPLNTDDLERSLLLVNDLAGVDARAVINPSQDTVGAADLTIIVERKSYDGQLSADNFGTRYLGPMQFGAAMTLNSWLHRNERISGQFVMAPDFGGNYHELLYGSLGYEQPIGITGTTAGILATYTHTTPGYTLSQFDVEGWSQYLQGRISHPFVRTRSKNVDGYIQFDMREVVSKNNIPIDPTRHDHIRALRMGATFEMLDHFLGLGYNVLNVEVARGLDLFGANREGDPDLSRPAADITFDKIGGELQRLQRVYDRVNLLVGVKGQYATDAVVSAEEFGVGGVDYGRGYDSSEIIGDSGVAGKLELQWTEPYHFDGIESYQLYGFWDAGRVWNTDATNNAAKIDSLASAGLGIRTDFTAMTNAGLAVAFPLTKQPQTDNDKSPRVYFNVNHRF